MTGGQRTRALIWFLGIVLVGAVIAVVVLLAAHRMQLVGTAGLIAVVILVGPLVDASSGYFADRAPGSWVARACAAALLLAAFSYAGWKPEASVAAHVGFGAGVIAIGLALRAYVTPRLVTIRQCWVGVADTA